MSGIKLVYFNVMGRAETARLILAQAGVSYEDKRIEKEEWPALKASLPMGQLPVLEVDGKTIGQSMAIARYCARRFGLAGKQLKVEKLPAFLASMEKLLKAQGGKYFAGSSLTWADIVVYQFVSSMKVPRPSQPKALIEDSDLTGCPAISALVAMVGALPNIKKWEQTRPVTPM